jgi:nucleotide-binding universal stress UspA family protein
MAFPSTILVAADFSEHFERALEAAIVLAKASGGKIHLVYAMHMPDDLQMTGEWWATLRSRAVIGLDACIDKLDAAGVPAESHLADEHPVTAILEWADKIGADLIVMGSRGRSGLANVMLGSVAARTLRLARCPVLTVKAHDD